MVTTVLVDREIEDGERLVSKLDEEGFPLDAALWLYLSDLNEWRLMIASPWVDSKGPKATYARIDQVLQELRPEIGIPFAGISVVPPNDRLISALRSAASTGSGISGVRFTHNVVGGQYIEDAYIYRMG